MKPLTQIVMAKTFDDALDVMFAIQNSNSLDEATNNVK